MAIRLARVRVACAVLAIVLAAAGPASAGKRSTNSVVARAAVVIDLQNGTALWTKNADKRMYPASTTKVMTAVLAIESGRLNEVVTIQSTDLRVVPSVVGLLPGEKIKLRDLVYGLMLRSGNDAARAIARHVAGSQTKFAARMNAKARELGCTGTHFVNAHGLPNRNHYTTARDLGRIMRYAMRNPEFREITGARHYRSQSSRMRRNFYNKNKLLKLYRGTTGGKPGYTRAAQQTLVAAAERAGRELVVVCLHSYGKALWSDAMRLFDLGFRRLDARRVEAADAARTAGGE